MKIKCFFGSAMLALGAIHSMVSVKSAFALVEVNRCEAKFSLTQEHFQPEDSILVVGSFSSPAWSQSESDGAVRLTIGPDGTASGRVQLPFAGQHQYKFVINNARFLSDPDNPFVTDDGFGGSNSLVECASEENRQCAVELSLEANHERVDVTGTMFNPAWEVRTSLSQDVGSNVWRTAVSLKNNETYQFKFIADGQQWVTSSHFATVQDGSGNTNNTITVHCPDESPPDSFSCLDLGLGSDCEINSERSVVVTDIPQQFRSEFSLERVFRAIAQTMTGNADNALSIFQGLFRGEKCSPTINGLTAPCRFNEAGLSEEDPFQTGRYQPTGLFNRFDLAPPDGQNCGEYRITFGRSFSTFNSRHFFIFESELPNPEPRAGLNGCISIAAFWAELSTIDSDQERARHLQRFFFEGLPDAGIPPAIHADNFRTNRGQIRLNQFMSRTWNLRQFEVVGRELVPVPVDENPEPRFFDSNNPDGAEFRAWFIDNAVEVLARDVPISSIETPNNRSVNSVESNSSDSFNSSYRTHLNRGSFGDEIRSKLREVGSLLTVEQVVNRATMLSCAGCHQISTLDNDLGGVAGTFSKSSSFVMINERSQLDSILSTVFIPSRKARFEDFLRSF